jgi:hypothetical protein
MNLSKKFKPSRSVLDIGPAVGIDNEPYDPHSRSQEDFTTGTGLILGNSKQDSSKAPRMTVSKWGNRQVLGLDHPDLTVASELLMKALGTGDWDFFKGILKQLADRGLDRTVDEDELNFMLSVLKEPKNTLELMLMAQIARVHVATMSEQENAALAKLARTFAMQLETLMRLRAGGAQTVTHVSVNDNAQAIVGNVTQTPRENVLDKTAADSPPALTHDKTPPMPIMKEGKECAAVSVRNRPNNT